MRREQIGERDTTPALLAPPASGAVEHGVSLGGGQGKQILVQVGVNVAQAALGDEIEIDTLDGSVAFKLPAGTQSGQQFRLRGKGVPDMRGGDRGDQVVTIHVMTPKQLSPEQRELFKQLGESLGNAITQQPAQRGFFDKVKDALGV